MFRCLYTFPMIYLLSISMQAVSVSNFDNRINEWQYYFDLNNQMGSGNTFGSGRRWRWDRHEHVMAAALRAGQWRFFAAFLQVHLEQPQRHTTRGKHKNTEIAFNLTISYKSEDFYIQYLITYVKLSKESTACK